jgi:predicted nucleic acid-binding protein
VAYLLDTNVVSELRKSAPDRNVAAWAAANARAGIFISALVIGEIRHGIEKVRDRDPRQADSLEAWLDTLVVTYQDRVLPVTVAVADEWGQLNAMSPPPPAIDGLMAATAKVHHLTLVTRNIADVAGAGVPLVNPFRTA